MRLCVAEVIDLRNITIMVVSISVDLIRKTMFLKKQCSSRISIMQYIIINYNMILSENAFSHVKGVNSALCPYWHAQTG